MIYMDNTDNRIRDEELFINLLLEHKDLVGDWLSSSLQTNHFHQSHKLLLYGVEEAFSKKSLLTKKQFRYFVKQRVSNHVELNAYMATYDRISMLDEDRDNFIVLLKTILDNHLSKSAVGYLEDFRKNLIEKGAVSAVQELAKKASDLASDSCVEKTATTYEPLSTIATEFLSNMKMEIAGDAQERITCGIKEIDDTMVTGFAPGTLTLFCGDVGSYKCVSGKSMCYDENGERISIKEIYDNKHNIQNKILSLDESNNKIYLQHPHKIVYNGRRKTFKVKTSYGFVTHTTDNHKYLTLSGYKELKELKKGDYIAVAKKGVFGNKKVSPSLPIWLGGMLSDGSTANSYKFTNFDNDIVKEMESSCAGLGGHLKPIGNTIGKIREGHYHVTGLRKFGISCGIDGKISLNKRIPREVFTWSKKYISNLLRMMYSCDGSIRMDKKNNKHKYVAIYHTSSYDLAVDVRDLLIKFGLISTIFESPSYYKKNGNRKYMNICYRVIIQDLNQVKSFVNQIGFYGDKNNIAREIINKKDISVACSNVGRIPSGIWKILDEKFKKYGKTKYGCRCFYRSGVHDNIKNDLGHCGTRGLSMSRDVLIKIAKYLDNDYDLLNMANSDIFWDKIVSVEGIGLDDVYDICMPDNHNFVVDNFITHNSTLMLNVGIGVWERANNVLFVPLEMPKKQMYIKLLARQLFIDSIRLQTPKVLTDEEITKIGEYTAKLEEPMDNHFYIMETYDRIPVSDIRREIEKHIDVFKPRLVVVDYIANLIPEGETYYNRNRNEASQIGDMLKALRAMGRPKAIHDDGFAVVSGAQLGRPALQRIRKQSMDKVIFNSEDVRGSHEYSADADYMYAQLIDEAQPDSRLIFQAIKTRYASKTMNGKLKGSLKMRPEYSLIGSMTSDWDKHNIDNIMNKVDSINIDEELNFDDDYVQKEIRELEADELSIGDMEITVDDIDLDDEE